MPLFNYFDLFAPIYEKFITPPEPDRLVELADLPVKGTLLDAGGGTGRVSKVLRDKVSAVVVVDLSSGMLRQVVVMNGLWTVCSKTEALPFSDNFFHRIILVDAMHHVHDQLLTARELWRVLIPGGRIVVEEPDIGTIPVKIVAIMERFALMRSKFLSPESIFDLFFYPNANRSIEKEGSTAWVIIQKT